MQKIIKSFAVITAVFIARMMPFNWIVGSEYSMFSWSTVIAPVVAMQCGLSWLSCFFISVKIFTAKSFLLSIVHRLPLVCAARVFVRPGFLISVVVPLMCIFLFIIHPIGSQAWCYSMYWFIPLALYYVNTSLWGRALQASFLAHAVGSVIWLYVGNIGAEVWLSLIPLVVVERFSMAIGIIICNEVCNSCVYSINILYQKLLDNKVMQ